MSEPDNTLAGTSIAVVGMAGRFPGARNLSEFWRNLRDGVESISALNDAQLIAAGASPAELENPDYVRSAAILDDIDRFDASFFGLSPRDAAIMDPQHRLFLQCAWEALENAGWSVDEFSGRVGVYAGSGMNTYLIHNLLTNAELVANAGLFLLKQTGNDKDVLATRVSYQLNLTGPSLAVQTACSTSLVAIHLACQGLLNHECDMAMAGGVTIEIPHGLGYVYREGEILSRDGHCRSFDAASSGTIFGSGLGIVVLRRLADAIRDGDFIHAIIRGTAINNDGARKVSYLAPSVAGQADAISEALTVADVEADSISYVETHGTGTTVGDPIEIAALTRAFRATSERNGFCAIGSLKTNVGHLDAAAGVAGFIKTVMALEHRQLPPSLNFSQPNPLIDFDSSPFYVNTRLRDWESNGKPRRAGVTSLGIGGTNAHAIVEEGPGAAPSSASRSWQVLTLAAKTAAALDAMARDLADHLEEHSPELADVAFTGHVGRKAFAFRRAIVCADSTSAAHALRQGDSKKVVSGSAPENEPPVIFLCTGQGSQYLSMARGLYESEPVFKSTVDYCADYLQPLLGVDLRTILFAPGTASEEATQLLNQTRFTQPALFVVEYAMAKLWASWGVEPTAMIGHSVGELAAACIADVFSLDAGLQIIAERGRLIQSMPTGSMIAVPLPERDVVPLLNGKLSLASINADQQCVVSGPDGAIAALEESLAEKGMEHRRLRVSHAFHSSMMDPILREFAEFVRRFELAPPRIPFVSSATGSWIADAEATDPDYWAGQLRQTVRFAEGIGHALKTRDAILLEIGPGNTLSALCEQNAEFSESHKVICSLRARNDDTTDAEFISRSLAQLWVSGKKIDWKSYHAHERRRRLPLPTYPFERERFWIEPGRGLVSAVPVEKTSLKDVREIGFFGESWKRAELDRKEHAQHVGPWLIFEDSQGLATRIGTILRRRGEQCLVVNPGKSFARLASDRYEIDPDNPSDYNKLLSEIGAKGELPHSILHLWSVCDPIARDDTLDDLSMTETMSFYSLMFLAQALGATDLQTTMQIAVVSNNLHQVAGEPIVRPSRALIAGPCGVIPRELAEARCINIDVELSGGDDAKEAAEQVIAELQMRSTESPVAYRKNRRYVQAFARLRKQEKQPIALRDNGVYLITGGLGGIGLTLAESIAKSTHARIALVGRSASQSSSDAERIRKIRAIEETGAEVLVVAGDVCDPEAVRRVSDQVHARFGPINGIIHTAGILDDAPILEKDRISAARVLAPKVRGTLVLESVFQHDPIDFFIMTSSVSSIVAPAGQLDYAAASAFLDSFAKSRSQKRTRYISIQWPRWTDVGMAADEPGAPTDTIHPLLGRKTSEKEGLTTYSNTLSLATDWIVNEHRLNGGTGLFPATGYLEMVRAAFKDLTGAEALSISDFYVSKPLRVQADSSQQLRLLMRKEGEGYQFSAQVRPDHSHGWVECASGEAIASDTQSRSIRLDLDCTRDKCNGRILGLDHSPRIEGQERNIKFGAHWRNLKKVWFGEGELLSCMELSPEFASEADTYRLHPALLDMATGSAMFLIKGNETAKHLYVPVSYGSVKIFGPLPATCYSHVRAKSGASIDSPLATFDISIFDREGNVIVEINDFAVRQIRDLSLLESTEDEAVEIEEDEGQRSPNQDQAISSEEGAGAFDRVLANPPASSVVVFPSDFAEYLEAEKPRDMAAPSEKTGLTESADSGDEVERTLVQWWKELLGIDKVGIRDNFFDLGGQSLTGVRLLAKVKKKYGTELRLATLFTAPTIEKQCALIRNESMPPEPPQMRVLSDGFDQQRNQRSETLIELRRGDPRRLFLVHEGNGETLLYLNLARRMPADVGVYGLEPLRMTRVPLAHTSVYDMAAFFVEEVRKKQPHGPYLLGGSCAGGVIAYEMAAQLLYSGEMVELVILLDSALPNIPERPQSISKRPLVDRWFKQIVAHSRQSEPALINRASMVVRAISKKALNAISWKIWCRIEPLRERTRFHLLRALLRRELAWPRFLSELTVLEIYVGAAAQYVPKPLSIPVVLVRATTGEGIDRPYREIYADETLGWKAVAQDLSIIDVDGGHATMFQEQFVDSLAAALMPYLQKRQIDSTYSIGAAAEIPGL